MNVVSLFSGVGGFDLGLEQAGMKTIYQCEWDKHATSILQRHWPHVPKWGDITTLTAQEILRHGQNPDVIAWGSPCQDLSVAGKRAGLEGERSGLFHEGMRIIKELRKETNNVYPRISIWENVAGALSSNRGADFGIILDEMAQAGAMVIEWAMLDAQYFGIPQRRRRVFVIAIFDPATARNCPDPLLPVSQSLRGDTAKGKPKGQVASRTLTEGVTGDGEWWDGGTIADALTTTSDAQRMPDKDRLQAVVVGSLAARDYKGVGSQYVDEGKVIVEPIVFDDDRRVGPRIFDETVGTLQAFMGTGGNNTPMVAQEPIGIQGNVIGRQPANGPAGKGHTEEGDPMFTLTSTDIHAVAFQLSGDRHDRSVSISEEQAYALTVSAEVQSVNQAMAVRRLTPLECERLMGWPDDHTRYKADGTEQADTHRYKQCGNGVASPVAKWIAQHILNIPK
jgi:DNA (cytosine-5)-methyltransferase 1